MNTYKQIIGAFLTIMVILFSAYSLITNHKFYFNYVSIEPVKQSYTLDETVRMISLAERRKKNLTLYFSDVLRCEVGGRKEPRLDNQTYSTKKELSPGTWNFTRMENDVNYPTEPDVCFMDSTITYRVFGFLPARQNLTSGPFEFVEGEK